MEVSISSMGLGSSADELGGNPPTRQINRAGRFSILFLLDNKPDLAFGLAEGSMSLLG
jgi:hypothetical protein